MTLSPFEIGNASGDAARIVPKGAIPADGDYALCLGSDSAGVFVRVDHDDAIAWEQSEDFDVTHVLRFRARLRGPTRYPAIVSVGSATAVFGFDIGGYPDLPTVTIAYQADTNGLAVPGQTGAVASILSFSPTTGLAVIDGLTGMSEASVGRQLQIAGAATGANNGKFMIRAFIDATSVQIENASAVAPDANNGAITWTERRRDDDETTIARGLVAAVNASDSPTTAKHLVDGVFILSSEDEDEEPTLSNGLPNTTVMEFADRVRWIASMQIDGDVRWQAEIQPRRTRDVFDAGSQVIYLTAGDHDLTFELRLDFLSTLLASGGPYEVELPAMYIDALVFDEVT